MAEINDRRWILVVFGMPLVLLGLVLTGYAGLFVVPGGPCNGGGDLTPPDADVVVAANDSSVSAIVTNGTIGGETTDRVRVFLEDAETDRRVAREWTGESGSLSRGDRIAITEDRAGFSVTDRDLVTVRWYGTDPDVAGFCPNGRTFRDITVTRVENASIAIEAA